ncbi:MAG: hypothetical protein HQM12_20065 [SAR324 cluster bacterium]|nr:hypothetical protein [SAR324 cluster bacterium]
MEMIYFVFGYIVGIRIFQRLMFRLLWRLTADTDTFGIFKLIHVWWIQKGDSFKQIVFWGTPFLCAMWYIVNNIYLDWELLLEQPEVMFALQAVSMFYAGQICGVLWNTKHRIIFVPFFMASFAMGIFYYGEYKIQGSYIAKDGAKKIRMYEIPMDEQNKRLLAAYLKHPTRFFTIVSKDAKENTRFAEMVTTELAHRKKRVLFTNPIKLKDYIKIQDETGRSLPTDPWFPHEIEFIVIDDIIADIAFTSESVEAYKEFANFVQRKKINLGWVRLDRGGDQVESALKKLYKDVYRPQAGETTYFNLNNSSQ